MDILPTVMAILQVETDNPSWAMDGMSLLPLLQQQNQPLRPGCGALLSFTRSGSLLPIEFIADMKLSSTKDWVSSNLSIKWSSESINEIERQMKELNRRLKLYLFCVEKKTSLARSTKLSHAFNCLFYSLCSLADKAIFFWWNNVKVLIDNNYKLMTTPVQVAVHYIYHLHSRVSNCPVPLSIFYLSRNIIF